MVKCALLGTLLGPVLWRVSHKRWKQLRCRLLSVPIHVLCVMSIVCRVLWVQRLWWLGGMGWASLCITCPLEVMLASKFMPPLKETCYEIHGWNNSGANTCALVEECLVLHCEPCVMIQILGWSFQCLLPGQQWWPQCLGCGAAATPPVLRHSKYQHQ